MYVNIIFLTQRENTHDGHSGYGIGSVINRLHIQLLAVCLLGWVTICGWQTISVCYQSP